MKEMLIKISKISIPIGIGIYLSWYFYTNLSIEDKQAIPQTFANANYFWVILSIMIAWASHFSRAYRWKYLFESAGYRPRLTSLYHSVMIGYIINLTIPRSGEVARAGFFSRQEKIPFEKVFGTIVVERVLDVMMLGLIFLITTYLQKDSEGFQQLINQSKNGSEQGTNWILYGFMGFALLGTIMVLIIEKIRSKVLNLMKGIWEGVKTVFTLKKKVPFILHTIFIWVCYLLMFWVCAQAIDEVKDMSMPALFAAFIAGAVAVAATPGGIGLYPILVTGALELNGIQNGAGFSILMWVIQVVFLVVFGLFSLFAIQRQQPIDSSING